MPPKAEPVGPPVPTDLPGVITALSSDDPEYVLNGLNVLATLDAKLLPKVGRRGHTMGETKDISLGCWAQTQSAILTNSMPYNALC